VSAVATTGCAGLFEGSVTRRVGGRTFEGRFVDEAAYVAYTEGALAEAANDFIAAERAYLRAIAIDPSEDAWTRVGAVRCAKGDFPGASDAFARALSIDGEYAPAWVARGRCALSRDALDDAAKDAAKGVALDPRAASASMLVAAIAARRGDVAEARRWLEGLTAREPWNDDVRRELAALNGRPAEPPGPTLAGLDHALSSGDLDGARRFAARLRVSSGMLALRAAALGQADLARRQASLVVAADPSDVDARVALLVAADVLADPASRDAALVALPTPLPAMSPLARRLLSEVVRRHASSDVAPAAPPLPANDPLSRAR
jgi:tetratricopeptide (TPR) repeat protein